MLRYDDLYLGIKIYTQVWIFMYIQVWRFVSRYEDMYPGMNICIQYELLYPGI
jgi:hypothetical protein